jgi:hypothetical protein
LIARKSLAELAAAEKSFAKTFAGNPRKSTFPGLLQSLTAQKNDSHAVWVEKQFLDAWKDTGAWLHLAAL